MRAVEIREIMFVCGGLRAYGIDDTYCPPGYAIAVGTNHTTTTVSPNANLTIGATGPIPAASTTLSPGTTTDSYSVTTTCVPDLSSQTALVNFSALNAGVMGSSGLTLWDVISAF